MDYSAIESSIQGKSRLFAPRAFFIAKEEETGGLVLCDSIGFVLSHDEINCLIGGLLEYYKKTTPSDIEEYNEMVREEAHKVSLENSCSQNRSPKPKKLVGGYVYFIKDDKNRVKIGKARNIKDRMGEYTKLPFEPKMELIFKCRDYNLAELIFHEHFKEKRLRGEWFKLSKKDIDDLKGGSLPPDVRSLIIEKIAI